MCLVAFCHGDPVSSKDWERDWAEGYAERVYEWIRECKDWEKNLSVEIGKWAKKFAKMEKGPEEAREKLKTDLDKWIDLQFKLLLAFEDLDYGVQDMLDTDFFDEIGEEWDLYSASGWLPDETEEVVDIMSDLKVYLDDLKTGMTALMKEDNEPDKDKDLEKLEDFLKVCKQLGGQIEELDNDLNEIEKTLEMKNNE